MGKKRKCVGDGDDEEEDLLLLLPEDFLIQNILVRLPVVSLLRFKSVSKSWCALIQTSFFIHLHNTTFNSSTSSNKFGSFILHAAVDLEKRFRENALLMLSSSLSVSESESGSTGGSWSTGSNGLRCVCAYESGSAAAGWEWSTDSNGLCGKCGQWCSDRVADGDDQVVFKADDDDDDQQQQQQLVLKLDNLGFPSCYQFDKIRRIDIAGSCNGLICIHDSELPRDDDSDSLWNPRVPELLRDVSLWNPATRQFRILPKSITIQEESQEEEEEEEEEDELVGGGTNSADDGDGEILPKPSSITIDVDGEIPPHRLVAFGFDAKTKDYKVVLVSGFKSRMVYDVWGPIAPMECLCRVQVYSLSTDSWRLLEGINSLPGYPFFCYPNEGLYLNGSCFFMAKSLYSFEQCIPPKIIISLDLTKEIITTIQLPDHHRDQDLYLCYLGDKIALFTAACDAKVDDDDNDTTGCYEYFNIWVLNYEHGSSNSSNSSNKESWTKLHSFKLECTTRGSRNIPRGISNDGEFAFLGKTEDIQRCNIMKLYNLVTKEEKKNFLSCNQVMSKAYAYKPSLVSITGGGNGSSSSRISQPIYDRVIGGAM